MVHYAIVFQHEIQRLYTVKYTIFYSLSLIKKLSKQVGIKININIVP